MKYLVRVIFLLFFLFATVFAADKTVDAPAYSNNLKKLYYDEDAVNKNPENVNYSGYPGAKFWRSIRAGKTHKTQVTGDDSAVLINGYGENWRLIKNSIANINGFIIPLAMIIVLLIYFIFGKFKIQKGFSGNMIARFKLVEMVIHWTVAVSFIILALTGLTLLLGKFFLIPIIGKSAFAIFANISMDIHDIVGPIFSVFLLLMIIKFIKDNIYQKGDINWLLAKGGLFGEHVDAWRFNLGEKLWFWIIFLLGR